MNLQLKGIILDKGTIGSTKLPDDLRLLCDWEVYDNVSKHEVKQLIKNKDIVLTNKVPLNELNLHDSSVKYIGVLATGINIIDIDYCVSKGIEVKNAVGYSTNSVAQHTFSMLLSFLSKSYYFDDYVKNSNYANSPMFTHLGYEFSELLGKKWGIIGLGNIGKKVADIATVFGAEVSYYSTSGISRSQKYSMVDLDQLLQESDFVSIHAPLNDKTLNMIDKSCFDKMKQTSILINVGRGGIVKEDDLIIALNKNQLLGACLDVFEQEPFDFSTRFDNLKNPDKVLFSPHIAWASVEARNKLMEITTNNLKNWIDKK